MRTNRWFYAPGLHFTIRLRQMVKMLDARIQAMDNGPVAL